jgi:hypothetical protein
MLNIDEETVVDDDDEIDLCCRCITDVEFFP